MVYLALVGACISDGHSHGHGHDHRHGHRDAAQHGTQTHSWTTLTNTRTHLVGGISSATLPFDGSRRTTEWPLVGEKNASSVEGRLYCSGGGFSPSGSMFTLGLTRSWKRKRLIWAGVRSEKSTVCATGSGTRRAGGPLSHDRGHHIRSCTHPHTHIHTRLPAQGASRQQQHPQNEQGLGVGLRSKASCSSLRNDHPSNRRPAARPPQCQVHDPGQYRRGYHIAP